MMKGPSISITMRPSLKLLIAVFVVAGVNGGSNSDSSTSFKQLRHQLLPAPSDVLDNLELYDKFWIQVSKSGSVGGSGCVWSECGIDDTDDAYMGDNRDGDEQWYQYRTQSFCANAAYSLYGRKKDEFSFGFKGCSSGHFINSFFTYGGADNLLKVIGVTPVTYYSDDGDNDDGANDDGNDDDAVADDAVADDAAGDDGGNDDADNSSYGNANCVAIDYDDGSEQDDDNENGSNDSNDNDRRKLSGSGSNDNDNSYSSSLGCSNEGDYIMAIFKSSSCDGNYFVEALDTFDEYNAQHGTVGCHKIWEEKNNEATYENIYALLSNSWSCDVRLYPNGCPDPFGEKGRYEYALRTAAHGGNPMAAYNNMIYKRPVRALSWVLLALTVLVLAVTWFVKNRKRIGAKGGGVKGCKGVVREDFLTGCECVRAATVSCLERILEQLVIMRAWLEAKIGLEKKPKRRGREEDSSRKMKHIDRIPKNTVDGSSVGNNGMTGITENAVDGGVEWYDGVMGTTENAVDGSVECSNGVMA